MLKSRIVLPDRTDVVQCDLRGRFLPTVGSYSSMLNVRSSDRTVCTESLCVRTVCCLRSERCVVLVAPTLEV